LDLNDPATGWRARAPLPVARNHLAAVVLGDRIYAIGGQRQGDERNGNLRVVERYDPATDRWVRVADLPEPRGHILASTFVADGLIFVVGGTLAGGVPARSVIAYDPTVNRWLGATPFPGRRT